MECCRSASDNDGDENPAEVRQHRKGFSMSHDECADLLHDHWLSPVHRHYLSSIHGHGPHRLQSHSHSSRPSLLTSPSPPSRITPDGDGFGWVGTLDKQQPKHKHGKGNDEDDGNTDQKKKHFSWKKGKKGEMSSGSGMLAAVQQYMQGAPSDNSQNGTFSFNRVPPAGGRSGHHRNEQLKARRLPQNTLYDNSPATAPVWIIDNETSDDDQHRCLNTDHMAHDIQHLLSLIWGTLMILGLVCTN
jgi:hypothetical protein